MTKYLHVIESSATGTLSMASLLANSQAALGGDVEVVYSRRLETPKDIEALFSPSVKITELDMSSSLSKIFSFFHLRSLYKTVNPDFVILHSSVAGFIGRLSAICLINNMSIFYIPHCISFMRKDVGWVKRNLFVFFERLASIKKCLYVACSRSEQKEIERMIPFCRCTLVENAVVDFTGASGSNDKLSNENSILVATVGQVRVQKNPELFARVAERVLEINPGIRFLWVGDGDELLKEKLLESNVEITGWMKKEDVLNQLALSDVYLSTSSWEGLPVSIIEAHYSNVPVVASNCSGNVDVVDDGVNGFLFQSEDEAVDLVLRIASDKDKREEISLKAMEIAKGRFSEERYTKQMNEIMEVV